MTADVTLDEIAEAAAARVELRATAAQILGRAWSPERYLALLGHDEPAYDGELWETLRSLGWADLLVPEDRGGAGATLAELCVLCEEAGAAAAPVPLGPVAAAAQCEGRPVAGMALPLVGADATSEDDLSTVSGTWPIVAHGAVATRLVVRVTDLRAGGSSRVAVVAVDPTDHGVERVGVRPLDHGPAATITFRQAPVQAVLATDDDAVDRWRRTERVHRLATVATLVGVVRAAHDGACHHARERIAFGQPIGAFQAVKHRLVDQRCAIEVARALTSRAADACDRGEAGAAGLTALAAYWATVSLRPVPEGAVQVFGGIAYTWEHPAHAHLRRAACLVAALGARADHRRSAIAWLAGRHLAP